ncbi:hypothetical protein [Pelodictyon luteolum]|uniref:hypothetical protein n=1 Tax=Pelodictyon luteolum TaxID=1100 RepID=UPI0026F154D5|nr:hypothetical protein [Pelodictyon luteolum]
MSGGVMGCTPDGGSVGWMKMPGEIAGRSDPACTRYAWLAALIASRHAGRVPSHL